MDRNIDFTPLEEKQTLRLSADIDIMLNHSVLTLDVVRSHGSWVEMC